MKRAPERAEARPGRVAPTTLPGATTVGGRLRVLSYSVHPLKSPRSREVAVLCPVFGRYSRFSAPSGSKSALGSYPTGIQRSCWNRSVRPHRSRSSSPGLDVDQGRKRRAVRPENRVPAEADPLTWGSDPTRPAGERSDPRTGIRPTGRDGRTSTRGGSGAVCGGVVCGSGRGDREL